MKTVVTLHRQTRTGQGAVLVQATGALGVLYSNDLPSLLLFWSLMVLPPVVLIWQSEGEGAGRAGCRYLFWHATGAATLLLGAALHSQSGDLTLASLHGSASAPANWLLLAGLGLGAAVLPLHTWLFEACRNRSPATALFPALVTTTTALTLMTRLGVDFEPLLILGAVTALYGALRALLELELCRIAAWLLLFQGGLVTAALGMGTDTALNGAVVCTLGHLSASTLLFMSLGAIQHCTGQRYLKSLAGLKSSLPVLCCFVLLACCSLIPIPGLAAYTGQAMIVAAAFEARHTLLVLLLHIAVLLALLACLRLAWPLFFDRPAKTAVQLAPVPRSTLLALTLTASASLLVGLTPVFFPEILPFPNAKASTAALFGPEKLLQVLQGLGMGFLLFVLARKILASHPNKRPALPVDVDHLLLQTRQDFSRQTRRLVARLEALNQTWRHGSARLARQALALPGHLERLLAGLAERLTRTVQTMGNLAQILNRSRFFLLLTHLALLILILCLLRKG